MMIAVTVNQFICMGDSPHWVNREERQGLYTLLVLDTRERIDNRERIDRDVSEGKDDPHTYSQISDTLFSWLEKRYSRVGCQALFS